MFLEAFFLPFSVSSNLSGLAITVLISFALIFLHFICLFACLLNFIFIVSNYSPQSTLRIICSPFSYYRWNLKAPGRPNGVFNTLQSCFSNLNRSPLCMSGCLRINRLRALRNVLLHINVLIQKARSLDHPPFLF